MTSGASSNRWDCLIWKRQRPGEVVLIIDAHQHFWRLDRGDYHWLTPDLVPLYQDFLPMDLAQEQSGLGVAASVLVQAAATTAETRFMLDLARNSGAIAGVVGWVDMQAPNAIEQMEALRADGNGKLKGFRPMIQDIADERWILSSNLDRAFQHLERTGLAFDALVHPRHLKNLLWRLKHHPNLKVVIDHCGKPDIAGADYDTWAKDMRELARNTSACCKFSGLLTQLGAGQTFESVRPYAELVLEEFGPHRLMWGSDWPVLTLAGSYSGWLQQSRSLLGAIDKESLDSIYRGTATRFYTLDVPLPHS